MLIQILFPICAIVLFGFFAVKTGFIQHSHIQALSQFVMKVSLPAFLVQALASKNLDEIWHPSYFFAYALGSLIIFVLAYWFYQYFYRNTMTHASVLAMGASMSNTGFIGTAILTMLIGSHAAVYLSLTLIIENLIIVALMLVLAEKGLQQQASTNTIAMTLQRLAKNPVILSILAGMCCVVFSIQLPDSVTKIFEMLGKTASPLALFVIGGSLVGMRLQALDGGSIFLVALKIVFMPLVIFSLLWGFEADTETLYVGTLLAALPMPVTFGIFGQYYGLHDRALAPLLLSTMLGFVVVAVILTQAARFLGS